MIACRRDGTHLASKIGEKPLPIFVLQFGNPVLGKPLVVHDVIATGHGIVAILSRWIIFFNPGVRFLQRSFKNLEHFLYLFLFDDQRRAEC